MPIIFKVLLLSQESTTVQRYPNLWILLNMSQKKKQKPGMEVHTQKPQR